MTVLDPHRPRRRPAEIETWVFDLDNTLYPASCDLFSQIDVRMRQFIAERLGLSLDDAFALQKRYYRDYGTTLRGLMSVNGIDPTAFLDYVHDIDHSVLERSPELDDALERLPGRKLIFTNGSESHALAVMERLGITRHFEGIFDIQAACFIPKPQTECYRAMMSRFAFGAPGSAMVEDLHRNLKPAHDLGMTTVWVKQDNHPDAKVGLQDETDLSHVDYVIDDLIAWLKAASAS